MAAEDEDEQMSDNDVSETVHNRLLGAVSNMYKQKRVKAPLRKESSLQVSEYHLTGVRTEDEKNGKIEISELARVLDKRSGLVKINEQIKSVKKKTRKLPKPLEKPEAERLERSVGYDNLKKELNKWDPVVYHQRVAEQVTFPLKTPRISVHKDPHDFITTFKTPTELELQLAESLNSSELLKRDKEEEELENFKLSLEEMKERRSIMARLRAQLSYKEAKAARQNRIKSKKFHRIQRKDRMKMQIKEFEELQKTDPEAALKKLELLEKARAQERASLRHRTTGEWARNLAVRAKYNKDARIALSEQLAKSRELTQKVKVDSDSEDEIVSEDEERNEKPDDTENSWLKKDPVNEVQQFYDDYNKYEKEKSKEREINAKNNVDFCNVTSTSVKALGSESRSNENNLVCKNFKIEASVSFNKNSQGVKISETNDAASNTLMNNAIVKKPSKVLHNGVNNNVINVKESAPMVVEFSVLRKHPLKFAGVCENNDKDNLSKNKPLKRKLPLESGSWSVVEIQVTENCNLKDNQKASSKNKRKRQKKSVNLSDTKSTVIKQQKDLDLMFLEVEEKINEKVTNKVKKLKNIIEIENSLTHNCVSTPDDAVNNDNFENNLSFLEMKKKNTRAEIDEELMEVSNDANTGKENSLQKLVKKSSALAKSTLDTDDNKKSSNIEPNNFFHAKPKQLNSEVPISFAGAEENLDDIDEENMTNDKSMTISEAFACDDVDEEFKQDKEEEIKKSQIEDVNLVLPGWGSWGGANIHVPKHKNRRFIVKFPKKMVRRDENKGNVVINEDKDEKIKPLLVTELPFPFTTVKEYEASIRAPIGRTWLPQSAHRKLIAQPVTTKLGSIIEPMTKDQILKNEGEW